MNELTDERIKQLLVDEYNQREKDLLPDSPNDRNKYTVETVSEWPNALLDVRLIQRTIKALQSYNASLTPEKLREEVALVVRQNTTPYTSLRDGKTIMAEEIAVQILSLVMAYYVEKIGGVENPHKPNPLREFDHEITMALRDGFNEAIQAVLEVTKEVE